MNEEMTLDPHQAWRRYKESWVAKVQDQALAQIYCDSRFHDRNGKLCANFDKYLNFWRERGDIHQLIEAANEITVACALLKQMNDCDELHYEASLGRGRPTIDFLVRLQNGFSDWIDVKTVAPTTADFSDLDQFVAWLEAKARDCDVPAEVRSRGAAYGGTSVIGFTNNKRMINARYSFCVRARDLERKIVLLDKMSPRRVSLLFCSSGMWQQDDLEDFADFYRTGRFRADDWSQGIFWSYLKEKNLAFEGGIDRFCYLERPHDSVFASKVSMDVRGPVLFGPGGSL